MRLLYSQTATPPAGYAFRNPRFFERAEPDAEHVLIDGDWPLVRESYEAAGVTVEAFVVEPEAPAAPRAEAPAAVHPATPVADRAAIYIPEDWRDLPWTGKADVLTLRQVAALVSDSPVLNKQQAEAAIQAELDRRAGNVIDPGGCAPAVVVGEEASEKPQDAPQDAEATGVADAHEDAAADEH